jgi:hypothetical protein
MSTKIVIDSIILPSKYAKQKRGKYVISTEKLYKEYYQFKNPTVLSCNSLIIYLKYKKKEYVITIKELLERWSGLKTLEDWIKESKKEESFAKKGILRLEEIIEYFKKQVETIDLTSDTCTICNNYGLLYLCKKCNKPYHKECIKNVHKPNDKDDWYCLDCTSEKIRKITEKIKAKSPIIIETKSPIKLGTEYQVSKKRISIPQPLRLQEKILRNSKIIFSQTEIEKKTVPQWDKDIKQIDSIVHAINEERRAKKRKKIVNVKDPKYIHSINAISKEDYNNFIKSLQGDWK